AQHPADATPPTTHHICPWKQEKRTLLSTSPLTTPWGSLEPTTDAKRNKLLANTPESETNFHENVIAPAVQRALGELAFAFHSGAVTKWFHPRHLLDDHMQRRDKDWVECELHNGKCGQMTQGEPPCILSPSTPNLFSSTCALNTLVKNPSPESTVIGIPKRTTEQGSVVYEEYRIPPEAAFVQGLLPLKTSHRNQLQGTGKHPIPPLPKQKKFNLILADPPWPNKSVRRNKDYDTDFQMSDLISSLGAVLRDYSYPPNASREVDADSMNAHNAGGMHDETIAAIWVTNSYKARVAAHEMFTSAGFKLVEEWVWVKVTADGRPVYPLDGIVKKPYEILMVGRRSSRNKVDVTRRVIVAVPDVHSRKPNLRELFEKVFFAGGGCGYSALEMFARNLTAGWWACGDQAIKFNMEDWWVESED
ncbi:hypothetical protein N7532_003286, partial [Penicillium argentinense]